MHYCNNAACDGFRCVADKKCISLDKRCDAVGDCSDSSDEFNCGNTLISRPSIF